MPYVRTMIQRWWDVPEGFVRILIFACSWLVNISQTPFDDKMGFLGENSWQTFVTSMRRVPTYRTLKISTVAKSFPRCEGLVPTASETSARICIRHTWSNWDWKVLFKLCSMFTSYLLYIASMGCVPSKNMTKYIRTSLLCLNFNCLLSFTGTKSLSPSRWASATCKDWNQLPSSCGIRKRIATCPVFTILHRVCLPWQPFMLSISIEKDKNLFRWLVILPP